jgi:hypothetical protein
MSPIESQPEKMLVVWIGRMRPKESHSTGSRSGKTNFQAASVP